VIGRIEEAHQVVWFEVLDDLSGEESAKRSIGLRQQVAERVTGRRIEPPLTADRSHFFVQIDAARRNVPGPQQLEKLSTAASHIEHIARPVEQRHVRPEPFGNIVLRSPKLIFESDVLIRIQLRTRRT
jgi:hypothetical protein